MNPADIYRKALFTTPLHSQLVQLHRQAGVFTRQAVEYIQQNDIQNAQKHIQYVEDIIAFLRSSLDLSLGDVSEKADASYAFYYSVMVRWFLHPETYVEDYQQVLEFWDSWAETWTQVGMAQVTAQ